MANGNVSLGYLRLQCKQRSDMENNPSISDSEWNSYIDISQKEVFDKLVAAYDNDYKIANPYYFSLNGSQFYPLPDGSPLFLDQSGNVLPPYYKMRRVDLQYTGSPSGFVTLRNFEMQEGNKYSYPNTTLNINGYTNLKYRILGNQLYLIPIPQSSQVARIWYIPEPLSIQYAPICNLVINNTTITASDVVNLVAGMTAAASVGIPANTTIVSVNQSTNQVVLSNAPTTTANNQVISFYIDTALMDCIAGWEEYVIVDAILKGVASDKIPISDVSVLAGQLDKINRRIESMAEGRDAGQAFHSTDMLSLNGYGDSDDGGGGGGGGWGGY